MSATAGTHERALAERGVRKGLGAYYTPPDVVAGLLDLVLDPLLAERSADGVEAVAGVRILDPACGTGNFLLAAVDRIASALMTLGVEPAEAARRAVRCVRGIEIDDATARLCRTALRSVHPDGGGRSIVRGDALLGERSVPRGSFDLVVGNPPFLNQLASSTARSRADAVALRARFGAAVGPYTDPAAVFLLAALDAARPDGGVVCLIEPIGLLSARDAGGVRTEALARAALRTLWVAGERVFDADVEVCAPVLVRGAGPGPAAVVRGRAFQPGPVVAGPVEADPSWASLLGAVQDLPERALRTDGVLGDIADAAADFRDQYYGLAGAVADDDDGPRLITSGLIDPAELCWGARPCRFNKVAYQHPRVVLDRLSPPMRDWAGRRLVPKVLVAAQTRVPEVVVDEQGELLPSVPVVSVTARSGDPADLWRIAALLSSPPVALEAARRHLGSGRNATALRLSTTDLLALPLPPDAGAWDRAAGAFRSASVSSDPAERRGHLRAGARSSCEAFGLPGDDALVDWWEDRLPRSDAARR